MSSSSSSSLLILIITFFISLISPTISQTCSKQNLTTTTPFSTCLDHPVLNSSLHYTYNASNSSLSIAFVATPPEKTNGWIAWAINPTGTKMIGSQAFLAYRSRANAAPTVKTYNISSYSGIVEGKLAFEYWNLKTESLSDGRIVIFTTVKVPAGADSVNQVWQIGGNVTNGQPSKHPFAPNNLNSYNVLRLTAEAEGSAPAPGQAAGPASGGSTTPGQAAGGPGNGGSLTTNINFGVNFGILILLCSVFIF